MRSRSLSVWAQVLFYLDISASMNHGADGRMVGQNVDDDAASSIRSARALIPQLAAHSLQRGATCIVVPWNHMCRAHRTEARN